MVSRPVLPWPRQQSVRLNNFSVPGPGPSLCLGLRQTRRCPSPLLPRILRRAQEAVFQSSTGALGCRLLSVDVRQSRARGGGMLGSFSPRLGCLGLLWRALAEYLATLRLSFASGVPMRVRSPRRVHSKRDGPSGDLPNCVLEGGPSFRGNEGQSRDGPTGDLRPPGALGPVASRHGRSNWSSQYVVGRPA